MKPTRSIILIALGKNHQGKTTFVKEAFYSQLKRAIVFDNTDYEYQGEVVCETFEHFAEEYKGRFNYGGFKIVNRMIEPTDDQKCLDLISKNGHASLVVEEFDLFDPPTQHRVDAPIHKLLTKSNHLKINIFATTQRAQSISRVARSQCHFLLSFMQDEPDDIVYLKKFLDIDQKNSFNLTPGQFVMLKSRDPFDYLAKTFKFSDRITPIPNLQNCFSYKKQTASNSESYLF